MIFLEDAERSVKQEQQIVAFNCWEAAKSRFNERLVSGEFSFTEKNQRNFLGRLASLLLM